MKITDVICHVLLLPDLHVEDTDGSQDDIVVEIHTDEGIIGIGESDTYPGYNTDGESCEMGRCPFDVPGSGYIQRLPYFY